MCWSNLWATWCAPCVSELPSLAKLQAAVPGLKVLAVDVGHDKADAGRLPQKPQAGRAGRLCAMTELALMRAFGAYGLPTTVLIDPNGKVVAAPKARRMGSPELSPISRGS